MDLIRASASNLLWRGIFLILFGGLIMFWPGISATVAAILWGILAIITGAWSFIEAFRSDSTGGQKVWLIIMGVISVIAGIIVLASPLVAVVVLTWVIGIWLIIIGVMDLFSAFRTNVQTPRWLILVGAILGIILGVLLIQSPATGAVSLAWAYGLLAIAWGITLIVASFQLRSSEPKTA